LEIFKKICQNFEISISSNTPFLQNWSYCRNFTGEHGGRIWIGTIYGSINYFFSVQPEYFIRYFCPTAYAKLGLKYKLDFSSCFDLSVSRSRICLNLSCPKNIYCFVKCVGLNKAVLLASKARTKIYFYLNYSCVN